jgi:hypothetical protein
MIGKYGANIVIRGQDMARIDAAMVRLVAAFLHDTADLTALIDATWPAKSFAHLDGWTIGNGAGGGSRFCGIL